MFVYEVQSDKATPSQSCHRIHDWRKCESRTIAIYLHLQSSLAHVDRKRSAHGLFHRRSTPAHRLHPATRPQIRLIVIVSASVFLGLPDGVDIAARFPIHRVVDNAVRRSAWWVLRWDRGAGVMFSHGDLSNRVAVATTFSNGGAFRNSPSCPDPWFLK